MTGDEIMNILFYVIVPIDRWLSYLGKEIFFFKSFVTFADAAEQKLASPVSLTPSAPSDPEIHIETVSFTVSK